MNPLLAKSSAVSAVSIEYSVNDVRIRKAFRGPKAVADSRGFYRAKLRAGADPRVVGAGRGEAVTCARCGEARTSADACPECGAA